VGQLFSQVLGMGTAAIPMLRGMIDQVGANGRANEPPPPPVRAVRRSEKQEA
jgi:hypothetical protein